MVTNMNQIFSSYVKLSKLRVVELLLVTTVPSMIIAIYGMPPIDLVLFTLTGGTLLAISANVMNQVFEVGRDSLMERTSSRPLVTGELTKKNAIFYSIFCGTAGFLILFIFYSFKTFDDEKKRVNLFATIKAKKSNGAKPIILSGHTDTVPVSKSWSTDPFKATIKGDKLYGRGSCDMKGFIACTLAFAPIYAKINLNRDIHFSFTFDEETACLGAPILIKELQKRNIQDGICIIGEPTKMKIIDAHKGCYEYTTYFEGLAGHSSAPHKGVSAVEFAARYASKLIELRNELKKRAPKDSIFDPPFSTLQVGGIFGGIAHNVLADM